MRNRSRKFEILMGIAKKNKIEIYKGDQEVFRDVFIGAGAPQTNGNRIICVPRNLLRGDIKPLCRVIGKLLHAMVHLKQDIVTVNKNFELTCGDKSEFEKFKKNGGNI